MEKTRYIADNRVGNLIIFGRHKSKVNIGQKVKKQGKRLQYKYCIMSFKIVCFTVLQLYFSIFCNWSPNKGVKIFTVDDSLKPQLSNQLSFILFVFPNGRSQITIWNSRQLSLIFIKKSSSAMKLISCRICNDDNSHDLIRSNASQKVILQCGF